MPGYEEMTGYEGMSWVRGGVRVRGDDGVLGDDGDVNVCNRLRNTGQTRSVTSEGVARVWQGCGKLDKHDQ